MMRSGLASARKLALLAPSGSAATSMFFDRVCADRQRADDWLKELQTLRGNVYLKEGAISPEDLIHGRHQVDGDEESWHLLVLDDQNRLCGCARYREHSNQTTFSKLGVANSALAHCKQWGFRLQQSVEAEIELSRRLHVPYVELGGWALLDRIRGSSEAFRMAISTYCLSQILGGAVGISTVTRRNGSASILSRMGGRPLEHQGSELPSYHDPKYECEMEVLRFWSWAPNQRYKAWIDTVRGELRDVMVVTRSMAGRVWSTPAPTPQPTSLGYGMAASA